MKPDFDEKTKVDFIDNTTPHTTNNIQERRLQVMADGCLKYARVINKQKHMKRDKDTIINYYDDNTQSIYCRVAKAANTSWKRTMLLLSGKFTKYRNPEQISPSAAMQNLKSLQDLPQSGKDFRMKKYFKFVFVREPLERLLSAYRCVFIDAPYPKLDIEIVRKYRPHDYKPSVKRYNITLAEFVRYILDQDAAGHVLNRHWIPQNRQCPVCDPQFDFIGHYETLHKDAEFVVSKLKSRIHNKQLRQRVDRITFPAHSGHSNKTNVFLKQMYSTVPMTDIQALYNLYAIDYELFGYEHPINTEVQSFYIGSI